MTTPSDRAAGHPTTPYDIAIVGGGPAGLTAAIWAGRYGRRVLLLDSGDPRNWETRGINGFLGLPGIRPAQLRGAGREEARKYDVTLVDTTVLRVESTEADQGADGDAGGDLTGSDASGDDRPLALHLQGGDTQYARRVLLAIGLKDVWPDIPGLEQAYGANAHVCPDCDGYEARGKRVVVIGNGRRALGMAVALTTWSDRVTIVTNGRPADLEEEGYEAKLEANGIGLRTEAVRRVCCAGHTITCLEFASGERLSTDKVFFSIAQRPADDLGVQLGCARDNGGHIIVSEHYATSVRSVFAAGDITPGPQLAIRAAAAGAVAAMAMHKSLLPLARTLKDV